MVRVYTPCRVGWERGRSNRCHKLVTKRPRRVRVRKYKPCRDKYTRDATTHRCRRGPGAPVVHRRYTARGVSKADRSEAARWIKSQK